MHESKRSKRPAWLASGPFLGALLVGAAAWAQSPPQEPPPVQYICLSNSCFMPQTPAAPRTAPRAAPAAPTAQRPLSVAQMQPDMADRLLVGLSDEERSTARFSESMVGDRVGTRVEFQRDDGTRGSRTIFLGPPSPP